MYLYIDCEANGSHCDTLDITVYIILNVRDMLSRSLIDWIIFDNGCLFALRFVF